MTPTEEEDDGMEWVSSRVRAIAGELRLDLDQHKWGQDFAHFEQDRFALALRIKGVRKSRTVITFDADDLADAGHGDQGRRGYVEMMVRRVLTRMAGMAAVPPSST